MEVAQVLQKKCGNNNNNNGGGDSKGGGGRFEGNHNHCGKDRHMVRDCFKNPESSKYKGGDNLSQHQLQDRTSDIK